MKRRKQIILLHLYLIVRKKEMVMIKINLKLYLLRKNKTHFLTRMLLKLRISLTEHLSRFQTVSKLKTVLYLTIKVKLIRAHLKRKKEITVLVLIRTLMKTKKILMECRISRIFCQFLLIRMPRSR